MHTHTHTRAIRRLVNYCLVLPESSAIDGNVNTSWDTSLFFLIHSDHPRNTCTVSALLPLRKQHFYSFLAHALPCDFADPPFRAPPQLTEPTHVICFGQSHISRLNRCRGSTCAWVAWVGLGWPGSCFYLHENSPCRATGPSDIATGFTAAPRLQLQQTGTQPEIWGPSSIQPSSSSSNNIARY